MKRIIALAVMGVFAFANISSARVTNATPDERDIFCVGPSGAEICVDASGNLIPTTDDDADLGTSSLQFKDVYIDGVAYVDSISNDGAFSGTNLVLSGSMTSSSATVNGAGGLGVTYGVSAGTLTISGAGDIAGQFTWGAVATRSTGTTTGVLTTAGAITSAAGLQGTTGVFTNTGASSLDIGGGLNAGTGNVAIIDATGKITGISSTYFASLDGSNLTGISSIAVSAVYTTALANSAVTDAKINDIAPGKVSAGSLDTDVMATSVALSGFYSNDSVRSNLGLAIGTNVQAWDADLDDLADGSLTGSKVAAIPAANISAGSLAAGVIASSVATGSIYEGAIVGGVIHSTAALQDDINLRVLKAGDVMSGPLQASSMTITGNASIAGNIYSGVINYKSTFTAASGNLDITGAVTAASFSGSGASLTAITAANISAGNLGASVLSSSVAISAVYTSAIADSAVTDGKLAGSIAPSKITGTAAILGANTFTATQSAPDVSVTYGVSAATMTAVSGYIGFYSRTLAEINGITPTAAGQAYYCSNCIDSAVCISSGTGTAAFVQISSATVHCN